MMRQQRSVLTTVKCFGGSYRGSTVLSQLPTATSYGWGSAVCDQCKTRLYLKGGKLPDHWLTVTIHEVQGNIHEVDEESER